MNDKIDEVLAAAAVIEAAPAKVVAAQKSKFVVFDPEEPPEFFDTEKEAKDHAEFVLDQYRDMSIDGWAEEVTQIEWGEYICRERVTQTVCEPAEEGSEFEEVWNFELKAPMREGLK
jgi:hypothetical protein